MGALLERHHRDGARRLGDTRLLGGDDVHDDTALEYFGHAALDTGGARLERGTAWAVTEGDSSRCGNILRLRRGLVVVVFIVFDALGGGGEHAAGA